MRKNLAPEQFKILHQHARVKVLLNCSAGININRKPDFVGKADKCRLVLCAAILSLAFSSERAIGRKRQKTATRQMIAVFCDCAIKQHAYSFGTASVYIQILHADKTHAEFHIQKKNISLFRTDSAIFCITIGYFNTKTPFLFNPFIHLQPSFAVLSEEINILLISPH